MSIILSYPQVNTSSPGLPQVQNWAPNPAFKKYYISVNQTSILHTTALIKIKDVVGVPAYSSYSAFRLVAHQEYSGNNVIEWLNPDCYTGMGYPNDIFAPINIATNSITYPFNPNFQNINLLSPGEYSFTLHFIIEGFDSLGNWIQIDNYDYQVILNVSSTSSTYSQNGLVFNHVYTTITGSQIIFIDGDYWSMTIPPNFTYLVDSVLGLTITVLSTGYTVIDGHGYKEFEIGLNDAYFDTLPVSAVPFNQIIGLVFLHGLLAPQLTLGIELNVFILSNTVAFTPQLFHFTAIKGVQEPILQLGFLGAPIAYTVVVPPWLTIALGDVYLGGTLIGNITVVPISTSNMNIGNYSGDIVFNYLVAGIPTQLIVPVTYNLQGVVSDPYFGQENAFTLDNKFYELASPSAQTYFNINSEIKVFDFFTSVEKTVLANDKVALFQGKAKINFSKRIHQVMRKFSGPNENQLQYKQAEFKLTVEELDLATNNIIRTINLNAQKFVAGHSEFSTQSPTFLKINKFAQRVTKNSFAYINMLLPIGNFKLQINKNNVLHSEIDIVSLNGIYLQKIHFTDFTPGDVINCLLINDSNTIIPLNNIEFIVFPENRYSNMIIWESNFLLQSAFEFTGGFNLNSDYETTGQTNYTDLVEVLEIIENKKLSKFNIDTGWCLQNDNHVIDSLMRSKRVWIINQYDEIISLRPVSKKMINQDSERELIQYLVEFQINREYDEKNYSF